MGYENREWKDMSEEVAVYHGKPQQPDPNAA